MGNNEPIKFHTYHTNFIQFLQIRQENKIYIKLSKIYDLRIPQILEFQGREKIPNPRVSDLVADTQLLVLYH